MKKYTIIFKGSDGIASALTVDGWNGVMEALETIRTRHTRARGGVWQGSYTSTPCGATWKGCKACTEFEVQSGLVTLYGDAARHENLQLLKNAFESFSERVHSFMIA